MEARTIVDHLDSLISRISTGGSLDTEPSTPEAAEIESLVDVLDAAPRELVDLTASAHERIDTLSSMLF